VILEVFSNLWFCDSWRGGCRGWREASSVMRLKLGGLENVEKLRCSHKVERVRDELNSNRSSAACNRWWILIKAGEK